MCNIGSSHQLWEDIDKLKKNNKMTYKNKAGSRGKVKLEDGTLTFRNAFTGNNYRVIVKKK